MSHPPYPRESPVLTQVVSDTFRLQRDRVSTSTLVRVRGRDGSREGDRRRRRVRRPPRQSRPTTTPTSALPVEGYTGVRGRVQERRTRRPEVRDESGSLGPETYRQTSTSKGEEGEGDREGRRKKRVSTDSHTVRGPTLPVTLLYYLTDPVPPLSGDLVTAPVPSTSRTSDVEVLPARGAEERRREGGTEGVEKEGGREE